MTDPQHDDLRHDTVHELLAAYVLDAVDEDERVLVEEHLLACPDCAGELAELAPIVEALAGAPEPVAPPAEVRAAVLRRIRTPADRTSSKERAGPEEPAGRSRAPADPAHPPVGNLAARRQSRATRRLGILVAAAAAVALFMFLAIGPFPGSAPDLTTETVAAAADAQRFEAQVGEATATVIVSRTLDTAAIETRDMPPAPEGQDYQLWFSRPDGTVTAAGLMPREEDAAMVLDDELGDAVGVAVTMEPEGGSTQPTSEPLLVIPFEA